MKKLAFMTVAVVFIACSGEQFNEPMPSKAPSAAQATSLSITAQTNNGGVSFHASGTSQTQNFDGVDFNNKSYSTFSEGGAEVSALYPIIEVEEFGARIVGWPETATTDTISEEKFGQKSTVQYWTVDDGQVFNGAAWWLCEKSEDDAPPHGEIDAPEVENKVAHIDTISADTARVTFRFSANVRGENSSSVSGAGRQFFRITYLQVKKKIEPTPTWALTFSRTSERAGSATLTITLSDGTSVAFPWNAMSCGLFGDMKSLFVTDTKVVEDSTLQVSNDYPSGGSITNSKRGGISWQLTKNCQEVHERRFWHLCGGGIDGAKPKVYFYTTDVTAVLPTGEKIEVHLHPKTAFGEDSFSTIESLIGNIIAPENENKEYVYNRSLTYSADHYVSCTVVDFDGTEKEFPVDCLENGLLLHNSGTVNLYTLK